MKVFFDTVGCRLNQAEIELMAGQFRSAGHEILDHPDGADLVVVNTCSVTAAAASDSRQKTRQAHLAGAGKILLTGCWATLEPEKAAALEGVNEVVSNLEKMDIPLRVLRVEENLIDLDPIARKPLPGAHARTRAFIKVQDGCDNFCTYCVTRLARGKNLSEPKEEILKDIQRAEAGGGREVVLSGVHLASWGREAAHGESIRDLLKYLLDHTSIERIRLSSIEPWNLDEEFFELWQNPRLCRHLHLPLQSGSEGVLKRMARHTTPAAYSKLVGMARTAIPEVAITTDIIVGFPGETSAEFEESLDFVSRLSFSGGHVFRFSPREGTPAARMTGRVNGSEVKTRADRMREILMKGQSDYFKRAIGKTLEVLWEGSGKRDKHGWTLHGLSDQYIQVTARAAENRWNRIDRVEITSADQNGVYGNIIEF